MSKKAKAGNTVDSAKKLGKEFKEFLTRGNVIALATGVILGGAFQAVINSLVNDIFLPVIGGLTKTIDFSKGFWDLNRIGNPAASPYPTAAAAIAEGHIVVTYGTLITATINFFIIGFVVFLLVKSISSMGDAGKKVRRRGKAKPPAPKPEPTTKECPFCCSEISIKATRCPHCTSELPVAQEEEPEEESKEEANV